MGANQTRADKGEEPMFYDRAGVPIDLGTFQEHFADDNYRFLRRETVARPGGVGHLEVVTAWLGLDQTLGDAERPLIFGTVALDLEGDSAPWEEREFWAATEAEALAQHADLTTRISNL